MNLSDNLKKIRKENNLSQEQLAEKLGVSRQSVSKWESGLAYPEMDKMLQLCKLFNLNMDDLLNQDIKEVNNNKQTKNNINKFIDDFLDYITKTIDMFSGMKFKEKIKCLFEQFIIILAIISVLLIIGLICSNIISNIISFLPQSLYYSLYHLFEALYFAACLILGTILILHIFKVRYLDYYIIIKEDNNIQNNEKAEEEITDKNESKKIFLKKKNEKIIIRDPKHSGYKFISSMLRVLLFIIKCITAFILIMSCFPLISLVICLVISFVFIKTGMLFVGILLCLLSLIVINLIVLIILYNFILSKKILKTKLSISFIVSLLALGSGIGMIMVGITNFDIIDDINSEYFISEEQVIEMKEDLFFETYHGEIGYVESENSDIKLVYRHSNIYEINMHSYDNGYYLHLNLSKSNIMDNIRKNIKDINDKKIIDYSNYKIYIYTTKENIEILKNNLSKHYDNQEEIERQQLINEYEQEINDLNKQIYELEENCFSN